MAGAHYKGCEEFKFRNRLYSHQACGSIGFYTGNLTSSDGSMKVRLKVLPNKPRDGAWPSSARAVRCPVKSGNERDLYLQLQQDSREKIEHIVGTASEKRRKVQATVGLYAPNLLGYTRATMVGTMGCNSEKRSQTSKPYPSPN